MSSAPSRLAASVAGAEGHEADGGERSGSAICSAGGGECDAHGPPAHLGQTARSGIAFTAACAAYCRTPDRSPPSASCPRAPATDAARRDGAEGHEADGGERSGLADAAQAAVNAMPDLHLPSAEQAAENHLERKPFWQRRRRGRFTVWMIY